MPPDDPISNRLRADLLYWACKDCKFPPLPEMGIAHGARAWSNWLMTATTEDLQQAFTYTEWVVI